MKTFKKLIMGLLVAVMVLGMGITAFAAAGTITVEGAKKGQTYEAYRVFDYEPADESNASAGGIYKLNSDFAGFNSYVFTYKDQNDQEQTANMADYFDIGDNGIIDPKGLISGDDAAIFGRAAIAYAKAKGIGYKAKAEADADSDITLAVDEFGYYVINSSLGSAVAVDTNTPNVSVKEKNDIPNIDKKVKGATNNALVYTDEKGAKHQIGDMVDFEISAELKTGGYDYILHDCADAGITLGTITDDNISFEPSNPGLTWDINNDYEDPVSKRKGYQIVFKGEPAFDAKVTVRYQGQINKDAVISSGKNINEAFLKYGHEGETVPHETEHITYPIAIRKIAKGGPEDKLLPGAKFELYRELDNSQVKLKKVSDTEYRVDPDGELTDFVTVEAADIVIKGLGAENYVLVETEAPKGYNLLEGEVTVKDKKYEHAQEVVVSDTSTVEKVQVAKVEDGTGLTLPSTGGIGTTIFYIVGGILIVAGIAYFIVRRKADAE